MSGGEADVVGVLLGTYSSYRNLTYTIEQPQVITREITNAIVVLCLNFSHLKTP